MSEVYLVSHLRGKKHQVALEETQKGKKIEDSVSLLAAYTEFDCLNLVASTTPHQHYGYAKHDRKLYIRTLYFCIFANSCSDVTY